MTECRIQLRRDTVDTAWGFRLQGGQDYNSPLVVQRVFSGSPSDGRLQRGDVLISINNHDVTRMPQRQAEEIVRAAGSALALVIKRTGAGTQQDSLLTFANEPASQPVPATLRGGFDNVHHQSTPPSVQRDTRQIPVQSSALPSSNKPPTGGPVMWNPTSTGRLPSTGNQQQFSTTDSDYYPQHHQQQPQQRQQPAVGYGGIHDNASNARWDTTPAVGSGGGGTTWNQNYQNASSQHTQDRVQPMQEYRNHGHPAAKQTYGGGVDESHTMAPQVIKSGHQQEDDDDAYESKSVRDIKAMFNKQAKPTVPGGPGRSRPPKQQPARQWQDTAPAPPTFSANTANWSSQTSPPDRYPTSPPSSTMRSFTTSAPPVHGRPTSLQQQQADLIASYPAPISPPQQPSSQAGLLKPQISSAPKPGAGYSYQGIVTTTPAKPVHKHQSGSSSSSSSTTTTTGGKKKEFDPSQSLVYQMLQEENERAKQGHAGTPDEQPSQWPNQQKQPQQQQQPSPARRRPPPQQHQQKQQGSMLQQLLERDRATSQQDEEEHLRYGGMSASTSVSSAPVRPPYQQQQQQQQHHHHQQQHNHQQRAYHGGGHAMTSYDMQGPPSGGGYYQSHTTSNSSYDDYMHYQPQQQKHQFAPNRGYNTQQASSYGGYDAAPISDY